MKRITLLFLLILCSVFVSASSWWSYYVSEDGDDSNDAKTPETAVATLKRMFEMIEPEVDDTYIIHISGTITVPDEFSFPWSMRSEVLLTGVKATNPTIQKCSDAEYLTTPNPGRFFNMSHSDCRATTIRLSRLTIKNFGFSNSEEGGLIKGGNPCEIDDCNIFNGKASIGALATVTGTYGSLEISHTNISGLKAISNGDIGSIVYLQNGDFTMINSVVEGCEKDYTIIGGNKKDNNQGIFLHDATTHNYDNIKICNNVFYNNRVHNPNSSLSEQQSVISLSRKTSPSEVIITNNIFIDNIREGKSDIDINNINNSTYVITNNILNSNPIAGVDNSIGPNYTYTSPEVAFAMKGGKPKYFYTEYGMKYVKANGTKVFRAGSATKYAYEDVLQERRDVSEYAPSLGVIDVAFQDALKAQLKADFNSSWEAPVELGFKDLSFSVDGVDKWYWDFDSDGTIDATDPDPNWIYAQEGVYDVTLIIESSGSKDTLISQDYVKIGYDTLTANDVRIVDGIIEDVYTSWGASFNLKHMYIPDSINGQEITGIGRMAFRDTELESVKFSSSLREIGESSFGFINLRHLDFSLCASLQSVGEYAFRGNDLVSVDMSACESLVSIGEKAFASNNINGIVLPYIKYQEHSGWTDSDANKYQSGDAFSNYLASCVANITYVLTDEDVEFENGEIKSLTKELLSRDIIIPDSLGGEKVIVIGEEAFRNVPLNSVTFSGTLECISEDAFYGCGLTVVDFTACKNLDYIGEWAFDWNDIVEMKFSLQTGLKSIQRGAFRKNVLTNLDLSLCQNLRVIHQQAFSSCAIENLKINASLEKVGKFAFAGSQITTIDFTNCDSLRVIGVNAFQGNELSAVDMSLCSQLSVVGSEAFSDNEALASGGIKLPSPNYESFSKWYDAEGNVFAGGSNVTNTESFYSARIQGVLKTHEVVIENGIIRKVTEPMAYSDLIIPDTLGGQVVLGFEKDDDFSSNDDLFYESSITSVKFPQTLQYIADNVFAKNELFEVDFSDAINLKEIGTSAFSRNNISFINWGSCPSLGKIGWGAFSSQSSDFTYKLPSVEVGGFIGWADDQGQLFTTDTLVSSHRNLYARVPYVLTDDAAMAQDGILLSVSLPVGCYDVIIPDTIDGQLITGLKSATYNSQGLFYDKGLLTVRLPESLETIGLGAFSHNHITEINLHECKSLTKIEDYAFYNNSLTTVELDSCETLEFIGSNAFSGNSELAQLELPTLSVEGYYGWKGSDGNEYFEGSLVNDFALSYDAMIIYTLQDEDVEMLGGALLNCRALTYTDIIIPEVLDSQMVTAIGDVYGVNNDGAGVFQSRGLSSVRIPQSVEYIANDAFKDNQLDRVDLTDCENLKHINSGAFQENEVKKLLLDGCSSLSSIGDYAFYGASLDSLSFAASPVLISIGNYAFSENEIDYLDFGLSSKLTSVGKNSFYNNKLTVVDFRSCDSIEYILPGAFKSNDIEKLYFEGCSKLRAISEEAFYYNDIDSLSFEGCENLYSIGYYAFSSNKIAYLNIQSNENLAAFGTGCFSHNKLQEVLLENKDGLTILRDYVFYANDIQTLSIKNCPSLTSIGNYCFKGNPLNSLTLELSSLKVIGKEAFQYANDDDLDLSLCPELTTIGNNAFYHHHFQEIDLDACHKLRSVGEYAFYSSYVESEIVVPSSAYEEFRFWESENDKKYYEGDTLSDLSSAYKLRAWYTLQDEDVVVENGSIVSCSYDYGFTDIVIPEKLDGQTVKAIGEGNYNGVFSRKNITALKLPNTIESIGARAFYYNYLEEVDFSILPNLYEIGIGAFEDNSLDSLDFTACLNLEVIRSSAFEDNNIEYVDFGENEKLNYLGDQAFYYNKIDTFNFRSYTSLGYIGYQLFYDYYNYNSKVLILPNSPGAIGWSCSDAQYDSGDTIYARDTENSFSLRKWYTLQDEDVTMSDGRIVKSSYDFFFKDIIIPDTLDGQLVRGLDRVPYEYWAPLQDKGLMNVIFPPSIDYLGDRALSGNELLKIDMSACDSLNYVGESCFSGNNIDTLLFPSLCLLETFEPNVFSSNEISTFDFSAFPFLKEINSSAFSGNNIDTVDFSFCHGLEKIGYNAFYGVPLKHIDFSQCDSLVEIADNAFYYNKLEVLDIASCSALASIGRYAFKPYDNDTLSFTLPQSSYERVISWVDANDFLYSEGDTLKCNEQSADLLLRAYYTLRDEDVRVVDGFIKSCNYYNTFKDIIIPDTLDGQAVIGIENHLANPYPVMSGKGLYSVQLPSTLIKIGDEAFMNNKLSSIDFSVCPNIAYVGESSFSNNQLDSIMLNDSHSLIYIGANAFDQNGLNTYTLPENTDYPELNWLDARDSVCLSNDTVRSLNEEFYIPVEYTLTDDDVVVENGELLACTYSFVAKRIIMPDTLDGQLIESIPDVSVIYDISDFSDRHLRMLKLPTLLKDVGDGAFANNSLKSTGLSDISNLVRVGKSAFSNNKISSVDFDAAVKLKRIEATAFSGNDLDSLDFKNCSGLYHIGNYAFYSNDIRYVDLSRCDSIISIGDYAFAYNQIDSIDISHCNQLLNVGIQAFYSNTMTRFQLPVNTAYKDLNWLDYNESNVLGGTIVTNLNSYYQVPVYYTLTDDDVEVIEGKLVACSYNFDIKRIVIPDILDGQEVIAVAGDGTGESAPFYQKGLMSVVFPAGLKVIESRSFASNSIKIIDFNNCVELETVGEYAFYGSSLKSLDLTPCKNLAHWGAYAFGSYWSNIVLPASGYVGQGRWKIDYYSTISYADIGDTVQMYYNSAYDFVFKPQAAFTVDSLQGYVPLDVKFTDSSTYSPTTWLWNFGDGSISTEENPEHTYMQGGVYAVSLISSNLAGADTMIVENCVTVADIIPEAKIGVNSYDGFAPCEMSFTDISLNYPTSWYWDFGDSTSSTVQNPIHTYKEPGVYSLTLIVGNTAGFDTLIVADCMTIKLAPPIALFIADSIRGDSPLQINFTDLSENSPVSWFWDFGNGDISTEQHPSYVYQVAGVYTVSLKVCNETSCDSVVMVDYISIEDGSSGLRNEMIDNVNIYPNPVSSMLTIEAEYMDLLQLVDMSGNVLIDELIEEKTMHLDMSAYQQGIYFLILENEDRRLIKKVIKE